jgi:prophage tail gpP-like protein
MAVAGILRLRQAAPTRRVTLTLGGRVYEHWTAVAIERDIADLAAGATLEFYDAARARRAFANSPYQPESLAPLAAGQRGSIAIDGEEVLRGWVAQVKCRASAEEIAVSIIFLDDAAHLVHCAAAPRGPVEYRNLTILQFAQRICTPFGITVRADVPVGAAFPLIGIEAADTVLAAVEKLARQREMLVTSDGVGGLVLTRGGNTPAPAPLRLGEQLLEIDYSDDWTGRFSDYYVKGQGTGGTARTARLDGTAYPLGGGPAPTPPPPARSPERAAAVQTGHARDPEITLYRPTVRASKTQSGGATVQQQADWMARVARGKGMEHNITVLDFRAGPDRALWRPNSLVLIDDPFAGVLEQRLIGSLAYSYGPEGALTKMKIVPKGAYDLDPAERGQAHRRERTQGRALDGTAYPLGGGPVPAR